MTARRHERRGGGASVLIGKATRPEQSSGSVGNLVPIRHEPVARRGDGGTSGVWRNPQRAADGTAALMRNPPEARDRLPDPASNIDKELHSTESGTLATQGPRRRGGAAASSITTRRKARPLKSGPAAGYQSRQSLAARYQWPPGDMTMGPAGRRLAANRQRSVDDAATTHGNRHVGYPRGHQAVRKPSMTW